MGEEDLVEKFTCVLLWEDLEKDTSQPINLQRKRPQLRDLLLVPVHFNIDDVLTSVELHLTGDRLFRPTLPTNVPDLAILFDLTHYHPDQ